MKCLVTGVAGLVGTNLALALSRSGWEVLGYDNFSNPSGFLEKTIPVIENDIRDACALQSAMEGVDAVIHLAAAGSVVESVADPWSNFEQNVRGSLCVFEAARVARVPKVIYASTGGALMGNTHPPVSELSLPKPISPYGASKLAVEAYASAYAESFGVNTLGLRFANVYGECLLHKKGIITRWFRAVANKEPITIFGDGSASRDYLYVGDLVEGIVSALQHQFTGSEVFHLASGEETSLSELAELMTRVTGSTDLEVVFQPKRSGEVERNFASYEKANRILNFEPKVKFEQGLKITWEWFRENSKSVQDINIIGYK